MKTHRIAVIAGDGIGKEVIPAGISVLNMAAEQSNFRCEFTQLPWGCDYYLQNGRMMDPDGVAQLLKFDAIYLGAIGDPRVADHISARELILPLRQRLGQYVNLRPMRLLAGITSPLANRRTADIDMICVRENSEGEYCGIGGRLHAGTPDELAEQTGIFTRRGIERIVRYAFKIAELRPRRMLASATKSNALQHAMVLWDEVAMNARRDPTGDGSGRLTGSGTTTVHAWRADAPGGGCESCVAAGARVRAGGLGRGTRKAGSACRKGKGERWGGICWRTLVA